MDATDWHGATALMLAARCGHAECARLLLEADADRTLRDNKGKTALEVAEEKGHAEVAALLRQEAEPDAQPEPEVRPDPSSQPDSLMSFAPLLAFRRAAISCALTAKRCVTA